MYKDETKMWHESNAIFKKDRAVIKLFDKRNCFKKSVIIPTVYYPLNGEYEVFHYKNTERVTDERVLKIFDKITYSIGHCYQNTKLLISALREEGYDAKSYVGWLFTNSNDFPVHHCWVVLDGKYVLDLSDQFTVMLTGENGKKFDNAKNIDEYRMLIASFHAAAMKQANRTRCYPVGTPTPFLLYIGCECDPEEGISIYQRLMKQFPDHECQRNCDNSGYNATQKILKKAGLMK